METITSFDDWIRKRRKALDMTQAQLAARVGCAVVTIKKIEQATRRPSQQMAEVLAEALAIPAAQREVFLRMARHEYVEPAALASVSEENVTPFQTGLSAAIAPNPRPKHFVGRTDEMTQLAAHLTGALNGSGRIVFVTGEAGHGKTTLMTEFARYALATYPDLIIAGGNSEAYAGGGNPYLPFRDILALLTCDADTPGQVCLLSEDQIRRLWAFLPHVAQALVDQGPALIDAFVSRARLHQRILEHPVAVAALQAQIESLAQQPPPRKEVPQRRLFEQFVQTLCLLASRRPLLLLLDDLQWVDRASADLLFYMARRLTGTRILFLGTYRRSEVEPATLSSHSSAGDAHPLAHLLQELKRRYGDIEIDLGQSTPQANRAFVDALLDSEPNWLTERFRAELFQRTQGHPLFTVELLHDMQERGDLVRDKEGRWRDRDAVDWDALPARVEAVISRRIGQLPPILQQGLKIASVEGETFTAEIIAHILGIDGWEMVQQFSGIASRQHRLITSQGNQRLGNQILSRYRFVHILFQSYLYSTLDAAERTYLHEAVGNALESLAAEQTEAVAVELARHFQAAGLTAKAIHYLHKAGRQAMALSAHHEAITHLAHARALLTDLPDTIERDRRELQLQTDLGVCYKITKGFAASEVEQVYRRAQVLCDSVGDPMSWACVLWGLHSVLTVRGALTAARKPGLDCLALAQDEPILRVTCHSMLGCVDGHSGELRSAKSHLEQAMDAYSREQHVTHIFLAGIDLGVFTLAHLAHTLCCLGYPDRALHVAEEAVELAENLSHPFSHASALSYLTMLHQLRGDWQAVEDWTEPTRRLCIEHDIPYYLAWTSFLQGWAMTQRDRVDQGIIQMEQSLADLQAMQTGLRRPYYLCLLAEAFEKVDRPDKGLALLAVAFAQSREQEQLLYEPDLHRVQGELLQQDGAPDERVETCFRHARNAARKQEAKLMELRAAASMAQLLMNQGRREEARSTLVDVVDWFDEGFEIAYLQEARALLNVLA